VGPVRIMAIIGMLALTGDPAVAQNAPMVAGQVTDSAGTPVVNALVWVLGTKLVDTTDREGRYRFDIVPGRTASIKTGFIGYRAEVRDSIPLVPGRTTSVDFRLVEGFRDGDIEIIHVTPPTRSDSG
jgi:hypothetical protein